MGGELIVISVVVHSVSSTYHNSWFLGGTRQIFVEQMNILPCHDIYGISLYIYMFPFHHMVSEMLRVPIN